MEILRALFDIENVVENFSEGQGGDFLEITVSVVRLITYEDIKLHKRW